MAGSLRSSCIKLLQVPWEQRVNRVTSATFRLESGAVGALTHTVLQHEQNFFTTFEVGPEREQTALIQLSRDLRFVTSGGSLAGPALYAAAACDLRMTIPGLSSVPSALPAGCGRWAAHHHW